MTFKVVLPAFLILCAQTANAGIEIKRADISQGSVNVAGTSGTSGQPVLWNGKQLDTTVGNKGRFRFSHDEFPTGCVGELTVGKETKKVVVASCGPVGPQGVQGVKGDTGRPGNDATPGQITIKDSPCGVGHPKILGQVRLRSTPDDIEKHTYIYLCAK